MLKVLRAKLHGIRVTGADLDYHGSVTLDPEVCDRAGIYPLEFVDIWNKSNGNRFSTYVILGEAGSRCCVINGSAARLCSEGDTVIIAASTMVLKPEEIRDLKPKVITFGPHNQIDEVLTYDVFKDSTRDFNFRILDEAGETYQGRDVVASLTEVRKARGRG
jgi:aspartate 1-decarboxylase